MLLPVVCVIASTACLVDDDARCQAGGFVVAADGTCACPAGSVVRAGRCSACGEHERADGAACQCQSGYERDARGACTPAAEQTDAGDQDAAGSNVECVSSTECGGGALCDVHASGRCVAAPAGLGAPCSSASDCAASEATYCELFSSRSCQIQGCGEQGGRCPGDMACCDYQLLSTSLCIPADRLEAGQCPAPGQLIERQEP